MNIVRAVTQIYGILSFMYMLPNAPEFLNGKPSLIPAIIFPHVPDNLLKHYSGP